MIITTTELQNNFGKYIAIMNKEPIVITKNGKIIGKLTAVKSGKKEAYERLLDIRKGITEIKADPFVDERKGK